MDMDMQNGHGYAAWTWAWSKDIGMQHGCGHAARGGRPLKHRSAAYCFSRYFPFTFTILPAQVTNVCRPPCSSRVISDHWCFFLWVRCSKEANVKFSDSNDDIV
jgi:hypothetical protein